MADFAHESDWFSRPGDSLIAAMRRRGLSAMQLANGLNGGADQLKGFVKGTIAIDKTAAEVLAAMLGGTSDFWLRRQQNYENALSRAVAAVSIDDAEIWLSSIPVPGQKSRGRLTAEARASEVRKRLSYFGVSSLGAWERHYGWDRKQTRFRTSSAFVSAEGATSLWLREAELEATLADTASWDPASLKLKLSEIARLSRIAKPDRFLPRLKALLASCGVALVVQKTPKDCKASGASRLINPDKALIVLSFRHRSDDQFWFTLFHEIGHLILHGAQTFIDDEDMPDDDCEKQANDFASAVIVPPSYWQKFEELATTSDAISRLAVSIGVSSGLILGQLQHRGRIPRDKMSYLRRRWSWDEIEAAIANL